MKKASPILLVVSSPSGAGKTTLCRKLLSEFDNLKFSTSHTTRPSREGEVNGEDYHFVTNEVFDQMIEDELFLEWAYVHGNRYGTSRAEVRAAASNNKDLLFDVDFQGAKQIKEQRPNATGVFVLPPSITELQRRLRARGTENPESLKTRFSAALEEIENYKLFDYIVVNGDLEVAYDNLRSILKAERIRRERVEYLAEEMLGA